MKKLVVFISIIFSLLIIKSESYKCIERDDKFKTIEAVVLKKYDFVQNGVKVEYTTNTPIDVEQNKILVNLRYSKKLNVVQAENSIVATNKDLTYNVTLYKSEVTRVEITLINNNNSISTKELTDMIEKIKGDYVERQRNYFFIKGKLNESEKELNGLDKEILNETQINTLKNAKIENGETWSGTLKDGNLINIGKISYNTGEYLIIGTPVIFTTY